MYTISKAASSTIEGSGLRTILICEKQVIIRKERDNDFIIEGPPVPAYWAARKIIYSHFAFLN